MYKLFFGKRCIFLLAVVVSFLMGNNSASAAIVGITGTNFNLTAKPNHISCADGLSLLIWGFADDDAEGPAQYPGPTLIVDEDAEITVNLTNALPEPVSLIFPGQENVVAAEVSAPTQQGIIALEALPSGTVSYTFTVSEPGTYFYQSGTNMDKQVQLGLVGALIVRPVDFDPENPRAYNHDDSSYDLEYLVLLSEMDVNFNDMLEFGQPVDTTQFYPVYWFINGRNAPDTMFAAGAPWLPAQPYNCMPMMHPGEKMLLRVIGAGRDMHPFHHHGNHSRVIAKDGKLLESVPGAGADLSHEVFTIQSAPGKTVDAIFEWTGKNLGWDIYGTGPGYEHECVDENNDDFDDITHEYCPDHGEPFPVLLPGNLELTFGGFWSGSPFMGDAGSLPPGEGGLNPYGGYVYMWHSHTEKEMVNNNVFPGGMMTMLLINPPGAMMME